MLDVTFPVKCAFFCVSTLSSPVFCLNTLCLFFLLILHLKRTCHPLGKSDSLLCRKEGSYLIHILVCICRSNTVSVYRKMMIVYSLPNGSPWRVVKNNSKQVRKWFAVDMGGFCNELTALSLMDKPVKYSFIQLVFTEYQVSVGLHWQPEEVLPSWNMSDSEEGGD